MFSVLSLSFEEILVTVFRSFRRFEAPTLIRKLLAYTDIGLFQCCCYLICIYVACSSFFLDLIFADSTCQLAFEAAYYHPCHRKLRNYFFAVGGRRIDVRHLVIIYRFERPQH